MQDPSMDQLYRQFGQNKEIPKRYEQEILVALSHYPELASVRIHFTLAVHAAVPYGSKPSFGSCFKPKRHRLYSLHFWKSHNILKKKDALFKNLTPRMRLGVLGHELGHVWQYEKCHPLSLLKTLAAFGFSKSRRKIERKADKQAIEHGLGEELLEHALYIRSIPGYLEKRPNLHRDYLRPEEIKYFIAHPEQLNVA